MLMCSYHLVERDRFGLLRLSSSLSPESSSRRPAAKGLERESLLVRREIAAIVSVNCFLLAALDIWLLIFLKAALVEKNLLEFLVKLLKEVFPKFWKPLPKNDPNITSQIITNFSLKQFIDKFIQSE